jgi:futalosine hydrolase
VPGICLIAVAAPLEARAVLESWGCESRLASVQWSLHRLDDRADLVVTGIGKANAAGAVARTANLALHRWVLSLGIAGSLPASGLGVGQSIVATSCVFVDEGLQTDESFLDCAAMGFPLADFPGSAAPVDQALIRKLRPLADAAGPIATVSTCSGTDALAGLVRSRTGALAEAMEGAAVALVARRLGLPMAELRVISNTTGSRGRQRWDLKGAVARLSDLCARLRELPDLDRV